MVEDLENLKVSLNKLWECDESYWRQRSRVLWLRQGDKNTSYFHKTAAQRRKINTIEKLRNPNGVWLENENQIRKELEMTFKALRTTEGPRDWSETLAALPKLVSCEMNHDLLLPPSKEEVKSAVFQLGALRSPGPDGFTIVFYQTF